MSDDWGPDSDEEVRDLPDDDDVGLGVDDDTHKVVYCLQGTKVSLWEPDNDPSPDGVFGRSVVGVSGFCSDFQTVSSGLTYYSCPTAECVVSYGEQPCVVGLDASQSFLPNDDSNSYQSLFKLQLKNTDQVNDVCFVHQSCTISDFDSEDQANNDLMVIAREQKPTDRSTWKFEFDLVRNFLSLARDGDIPPSPSMTTISPARVHDRGGRVRLHALRFSGETDTRVAVSRGGSLIVRQIGNGSFDSLFVGQRHSELIVDVDSIPTRNLIFTGSYDHSVRVWSLKYDALVGSGSGPASPPISDIRVSGPVSSMCCLGENYVLVGGETGYVSAYDVRLTGREMWMDGAHQKTSKMLTEYNRRKFRGNVTSLCAVNSEIGVSGGMMGRGFVWSCAGGKRLLRSFGEQGDQSVKSLCSDWKTASASVGNLVIGLDDSEEDEAEGEDLSQILSVRAAMAKERRKRARRRQKLATAAREKGRHNWHADERLAVVLEDYPYDFKIVFDVGDDDVELDCWKFLCVLSDPVMCSDEPILHLDVSENLPMADVTQETFLEILMARVSVVPVEALVQYFHLFCRLRMKETATAIRGMIAQMTAEKHLEPVKCDLEKLCQSKFSEDEARSPAPRGGGFHSNFFSAIFGGGGRKSRTQRMHDWILEKLDSKLQTFGGPCSVSDFSDATGIALAEVLFRNVEFGNITLRSINSEDADPLPANAVILLWKSNFFFHMKNFGGVETSRFEDFGELLIDMDPEVLLAFVELIYLGELRTPEYRTLRTFFLLLHQVEMHVEKEMLDYVLEEIRTFCRKLNSRGLLTSALIENCFLLDNEKLLNRVADSFALWGLMSRDELQALLIQSFEQLEGEDQEEEQGEFEEEDEMT